MLLVAQFTTGQAARADSEIADALMRGRTESAIALLNRGADVNAAQADGATALHWAAYLNDPVLARRLLEAGAEIDRPFVNGETALMMAARTGDVASIDGLLAAGANIRASENLRGTIALMWAAAYSNSAAVARLLEHGADPGVRSGLIDSGREPYLAPTAHERI
jgi:ankyrin repeat protein